MAYESFDEFLKTIAEQYKKNENSTITQFELLTVLCNFHDIACAGKLRTQKGATRKLIYSLNEGFAKGYFETSKKKK